MIKVAVISEEASLRQYLITIFENVVSGIETTELLDPVEAETYLTDKTAAYHVIFCDGKFKSGTLPNFITFLEAEGCQTPLVVINDEPLDYNKIVYNFFDKNARSVYIKKPLDFSDLSHQIEKTFASLVPLDRNYIDHEYKKVRINYFLRFNVSELDIFIRLSPYKYVKLINKSETYERKNIVRYASKHVDFLYVIKDDFRQQADRLRVLPFLSFTKPANMNEQVFNENMAHNCHAVTQELLNNVGFDKEIVNITETYAKSVEGYCARSNLLLQQLKKNKKNHDYIIQHSFMTAVVAGFIARTIGGTVANSQDILSFAAILHDIVLTDPKLAQIEGKHDPRTRGFSKKDLDKYYNHPEETAQFIEKSKAFPPEVANIIREHHELPNGKGFPHQKSGKFISPLGSIFIVAHSFASWIFRDMFEGEQTNIAISSFFQKYKDGHFVKAVDALQKVLDSTSEETWTKLKDKS
jgi:putative nucleotidyltransferase with HDIG domain